MLNRKSFLVLGALILAFSVIFLPIQSCQGDEVKTHVLKASKEGGVEPLRFVFFTDPHFYNTHSSIRGYEKDNVAIGINSLSPDYIFTTGDVTNDSTDEQYRAYKEWKDGLTAPVIDTIGNHDHPGHHSSGYKKDGYFTVLNWTSSARTYKLGNNVFIICSLGRVFNPNRPPEINLHHDKRLEWLENQLATYCPNNNVFVFQHIPIFATVKYSVSWSHQMGPHNGMERWNCPFWIYDSENLKDLINKYHPDAFFFGDIHLDWDWKDTPDDGRDGKYGVENVGNFVNGWEDNQVVYPDTYCGRYVGRLAETCYYLIPDIGRHHGWYQGSSTKLSISWMDLREGAKNTVIKVMEIMDGDEATFRKNVDNHILPLSEEIDLRNGELEFVDSDISFRKCVTGEEYFDQMENKWFKVRAGGSSQLEFSKRFANRVIVENVRVGNTTPFVRTNFQYKGSLDNVTWEENWHDNPEDMLNGEGVYSVLIRGSFEAVANSDLIVNDLEVITSEPTEFSVC